MSEAAILRKRSKPRHRERRPGVVREILRREPETPLGPTQLPGFFVLPTSCSEGWSD